MKGAELLLRPSNSRKAVQSHAARLDTSPTTLEIYFPRQFLKRDRCQALPGARECAIADAIENAKRILEKIGERWPTERLSTETCHMED